MARRSVGAALPSQSKPTAALSPASSAWRSAFRRRLIAWYRRHARRLPWRETRDPYQIWVSEVMLQQTLVATVTAYFSRFVERFPTIAALASAPEDEVLKLWEGLGYYRRARQLHRAAQVIRDEHDGEFPRQILKLWEGLGYYRRARQLHRAAQVIRDEHDGEFPRQIDAARSLPGVGRYTAGAVLSIAHDDPHPILEANTIRLFARLLAYRGDVRSAAGQQALWAMAEALLPKTASGELNQALMELGSQVCTPRDPACDACPVAALCPTRAAGLTASIPAPQVKTQITAVREAALLVRRGSRVLLVRREVGERWAGLWDFPRYAIDPDAGAADPQLTAQVARDIGAQIRIGERLTTIKHSVTRYRITLDCFAATYIAADRKAKSSRTIAWVDPTDLSDYPLSTTGRKLCRLVTVKNRVSG
jgi:A/G-specific adenine glycosylase